MDFLQERLHAVEVLEPLERLLQQLAGALQALADLFGLVGDVADVVQIDLVGHLLGQVHDLVERMRQQEDVLLVDRGDERTVREPVNLVGYVVRLVLEVA